MSDRRKMHFFDWLTGAAFLAMGVFLGLAVGEWLTLEGAAFWNTAIYIFIPFGFLFVFIFFLGEVTDLSAITGVKRATSKRTKEPKPRALLASFPTGFFIGAAGAQFGLTEMLL